jgi:hypothetical protein
MTSPAVQCVQELWWWTDASHGTVDGEGANEGDELARQV